MLQAQTASADIKMQASNTELVYHVNAKGELLLPEGIKTIESKSGASSASVDLPSFILSLHDPADEDHGTVLAGTLAWSGNFKLLFENMRFNEDVGHLLLLKAGVNSLASPCTLPPGQVFTTPSFIFTLSSIGNII